VLWISSTPLYNLVLNLGSRLQMEVYDYEADAEYRATLANSRVPVPSHTRHSLKRNKNDRDNDYRRNDVGNSPFKRNRIKNAHIDTSDVPKILSNESSGNILPNGLSWFTCTNINLPIKLKYSQVSYFQQFAIILRISNSAKIFSVTKI